jgi:hypothetical protein
MIRCTLELLPGGSEKGKKHLGTILIENNVLKSIQTRGKRGSYRYSLFKKKEDVVSRQGHIESYPRESYSVWELIRRILEQEKGRL